MDEPKIAEWTEQPWNPTTGCDKVSSGCKNCYAETKAIELQSMGEEKQPKYTNGFELTLHRGLINQPYRWKKSKRIFLGSMTDAFHEDIPIKFLDEIF